MNRKYFFKIREHSLILLFGIYNIYVCVWTKSIIIQSQAANQKFLQQTLLTLTGRINLKLNLAYDLIIPRLK